MSPGFNGWQDVASHLQELVRGDEMDLNDGQRASLLAIAERINRNGVIIADEVGMGKTRIAAAVAKCVIAQAAELQFLCRRAWVINGGMNYEVLALMPPKFFAAFGNYCRHGKVKSTRSLGLGRMFC